MKDNLLLSKAPAHSSLTMDYTSLRQEGIRLIEHMGSKLWTDYNTHDPGITILEQLCYAITDLGYRINHELPDILSEDSESPFASLFKAEQILTSKPVTLLDLRKLIIDIKGVRNAWIEKVEQSEPYLYFHKEKQELHLISREDQLEPVFLQGLYQVWVEPDIDDQENLYQRVSKQLHACRNLSEDFTQLNILGKQGIQIDAKIEIDSVENTAQVLLDIYEQIDLYFSPPLRFYSLSERLAEGKGIDEIFDGPRLQHGFIDSAELQKLQRHTELRTSDLIRVIMTVKGIRAIQDFKFVKVRGEGQAPDDVENWLLRLNSPATPQLDVYNSRIVLLKDKIEIATLNPEVQTQYKKNAIASRKPYFADENTYTPSKGHSRDISNFLSIQHQFPDVYGINSNGLSNTATAQRSAQAKQLKAYLLFFDQLLANYFAQLAHVNDLFSFSGNTRQTYFSQLVDDPELGLDEYKKDYLGLWAKDKNSREMHLQQITEISADATNNMQINDRKNRFLNHLLARFAEQFTDYSLAVYSLNPQDPDQLIHDDLIESKQAFLQDYPALSSARGTASNYLNPIGSNNRSGLEQRIRHKLGIVNTQENFYLIEHILLRPTEDDSQQQAPLLGNIDRKDPYSLQISFVFPGSTARFTDSGFRQFVEQTVRDECPVHLTIYIRWLDAAMMQSFELAYNNKNWLEKKRQQWLNKPQTSNE